MDAERMRGFLRSLPHVVEAEQWGGLLFWVGDKAIGGKTFAMVNLDASGGLPISFHAGPERFAEFCEWEGMVPAPYSARNFWVAAERWDSLRNVQWEEELRAGYALTVKKLTPRTRAVLALPKREQARVIAERRKVLAERDAVKKTQAATRGQT
jgi:predicted DNA-binding protein (MmcQ/YjbR family)